jgi:hypothetical protein
MCRMSRLGIAQWELLERRSPTLFLVGSGLLVGHTVIRAFSGITDAATPPDAFGPAGYLLVLVALYGLYPELADRSPRLARAGAVLAAVPVLDYALILTFGFGEMVGVVPRFLELVPLSLFFPIHQGAMVLTYGVFGVAVIRTECHPRRVGVLLLVPVVLILALLVGSAIVESAVVGVIVGSGMVLVNAAIGYSLGPGQMPTDHETPTGDGTVG